MKILNLRSLDELLELYANLCILHIFQERMFGFKRS